MGSDRWIWLIGGTGESARLAQLLLQSQLPCVVTVTTEAARSLYPVSPLLQVWVGRLTAESLAPFLHTGAIGAILDASHPFAVEISQSAIAAAAQCHLPYLRFERASVESLAVSADPDRADPDPSPHLIFDSFDHLLSSQHLLGQRVLLTIGYRFLPLFQPWHDRAVLFARLLPSVVALETAQAAGFSSDRLIALRPPVSLALERALWQQWQISQVVMKASGAAGGEDVKQQVAAELGVQRLTIARPSLPYPQQTSDETTAIEFCRRSLASLPATR